MEQRYELRLIPTKIFINIIYYLHMKVPYKTTSYKTIILSAIQYIILYYFICTESHSS
jgi:hypothetical protein